MLARQRHAYILERVNVDGAVRVADLVRDLGVSDMTVRRDLEYLGQRGAVERVHGGATAISGTALFEPGFTTKSALRQREKEAIAEAAAGLVEPQMAIAVSAGSTTYALARRLADVVGLTVVTNAVRIAEVLHEIGRSDQTIILTGGVRTPSDALVGPFAVAALRTVHVDLVFLGVHGMDEASGFGLGLSIANAIVLAHGGVLSLHDRQPHGLIVRIQLPCYQTERGVHAASVFDPG